MKKFIIITICVGLIANGLWGQEENERESTVSSPQEQSSTSLYTGGISLNVPIYTIQDADFTLPVSLTYTANGYMQNQSCSAVGYNWTLNAGSAITRKIVGSNEEKLEFLRNGIPFQNKEEFFSSTNSGSNYGICPYAPDIFTFSLNGCSGWFYIDFQGEIRVVSNEHFVVDLSEFYFPTIYNSPNNAVHHITSGSIIKITDKNGYTYIYGEDSDALSYHPERRNIPIVDAWHLTKIVAPNGREMKFSYLHIARGPNPIKSTNFPKRDLLNSTQPTLYDEVSYEAFFSKYRTSTEESEYRQIPALLQKISIDNTDFEMIFNYDVIPKENYAEYYLQSIDLKIENEVKTATFERQYATCQDYYIFQNFIQKHFLKKIKTFQDTKYQFSYNLNCANSTIPTYVIYRKDDYGYSKVNSQFGLLTSMTNPMGGKTEFYYEPHNYSEMKIYSLGNNEQFNISIVPAPRQDLYNNVRIQKIKTLDENNTLISTKEYTYSGGMLHCDFAVKNQDGTYGLFERAYSKFTEPIPLTYSNVTERISFPNPNEKIYENIYKFHEYNEMPDIVEYYRSPNDNNVPLNIFGFASMSERRGLIKEKLEKENNVLVKKSAFYYPQIVQNQSDYMVCQMCDRDIKYKMYYAHTTTTKIITTNYINGNAIITSNELYYDNRNRLIEKKTDGIDGRKYFTKYKYADDIIPMGLYSTANSSDNSIITYLGFAGGFQQIQRQCWFGRPIEVVSGYYENGTPYYTDGTISLFKRQNDNILLTAYSLPTNPAHYLSNASPYTPTHSGFAVLSQEWVLTLDAPVTDYQFIQNNSGDIVFDSRYIKVTDYTYNDMLRLIKLKPANALETTYAWDSNNLYPISETTGIFTTTYTYKPFVGKISETDTRGVKLLYEYDPYWRLKKIKREKNGVIETLQEYEYNINN